MRKKNQESDLFNDGYQISLSQYRNLFSEESLSIQIIIITFIKVHERMSVNTTY